MKTVNKMDLNQVVDMNEAALCTISNHNGDYYLNMVNGTISNIKYDFIQKYELSYSQVDDEYMITNHNIDDTELFYEFQDKHIYSDFKTAFINIVKASSTVNFTEDIHLIKTTFNNEYIMQFRPFGLGTFPRVEIMSVDNFDKYKDGYWSIVTTKEALSDKDIAEYELKKKYN